MKKRITSMICIAALLVTASQTITVEGKSKSQELLPAKQISGDFCPNSANHGRNVRKTDNTQTLTLSSLRLYNKLVQSDAGISPKSAITAQDEETKTITLNMEQVTGIQLYGLADADKTVLQTLLAGCKNLERLVLQEVDLNGFDFSALNNSSSLKGLYLYRCNLESAPDIVLPELTSLCLSRNTLTDTGAASVTSGKFPKLTTLYLDLCGISDVSFLANLGKLQSLSFANNSLTDASITALIGMKNEKSISSLQALNLGKGMYTGRNTELLAGDSSNQLADTANLALLPESFPALTSLNLSGLKITSLADFQNVGTTVNIDFTENKISDFTGLEGKTNFNVNKQTISLSGSFFKGCSYELPALLKRILDGNDVLNGTLSYTGCSLSDDGQKIVIPQDAASASVTVASGKLDDTEILFSLKNPVPEIPKNLTAMTGDTLAQVTLPDGFTWKNPAQDVGLEGVNTFPAVYTTQVEGIDYVWDVDIPVTVSEFTTGTPATASPAPTATASPAPTATASPAPTATASPAPPATASPAPPATASPAPTATASPVPTAPPTLTPSTPTSIPTVPATSTPTPTAPTPTQVPETPAPTPETPTSTPPSAPTQVPETPTPAPDNSKLTGNQISFAAGKQKGKNSIKLTWDKQNGCTGYEIYWSFCDGKRNFKKLKTIKSSGKCVYIHTNLKKTKAYKYYIAAYTIENGKKHYISKSHVIHVAMNQEKHTNVKNVKLNKTKLTLKQGKTYQIKATAVSENKNKKLLAHEPKFRYYTENSEVAIVTKNGKIKAKKKGTCIIHVVANNGVAKTVTVTIK